MNTDVASTVHDVIWRRRVTRDFADRVPNRPDLDELAQAASRAPSGGGRRPVRAVIVEGRREVDRVASFSPGLIGQPPALVVLSIDWSRTPHLRPKARLARNSLEVDVGAAMQNVLLLAEAKGLGACPVMSFHQSSVSTVLGLDAQWTPIAFIAVGHPWDDAPRRPTGQARHVTRITRSP